MKRQWVLVLMLTMGLLLAPVFGYILAPQSVGNAVRVRAGFDGNGCADLAVGVPYEDVGAVLDAGALNILYGSAGGLSATGDQIWGPGELWHSWRIRSKRSIRICLGRW